MGYEWDFSVVFRDFDLLLLGLLNTLKVTGLALALGVPLGLVLALLRLFGTTIVRWPVGLVIEFLRTTPPIAQLFWFFFCTANSHRCPDRPVRGGDSHLFPPILGFLRRSFSGRHRLDRHRTVGSRARNWDDAQ